MSLSRGRPPKKLQQDIANTLRPYFERGLSAASTSRQTGHDIKTVCSYFNEWSQKIAESEEKDYFVRYGQEKQRIILCLDNLISEEYQVLDELKNEVQNYKNKHKPIPKYFINSIHNCIKIICELTENKAPLILEEAPRDVIDKCVSEMLEKKYGSR